jgi:hypothetical protein
MPGILIGSYNPNNKRVNDIGKKELDDRAKRIEMHRKYYDGEQYRWLRPAPGETRDDNIILNMCGRAVDKMTEFIGTPKAIEVPGKAITPPPAQSAPIPVYGEGQQSRIAPAQEDVDAIWDEHKADVPEIILSGLLAGHSFIKLHIEDDEPQMTLLDPMFTQVFWNEINPRKIMFYRMMWNSGGVNYMQDVVPNWLAEAAADADAVFNPPKPDYWYIIDYKRQRSAQWVKMREERWIWEFAPIVDWPMKKQPHEYYGRSMLHRLINTQDALNFIASNTGRIIKFHADPKTFMFGDSLPEAPPAQDGSIPPAGSVEFSVNSFWDGLNAEARVETLELQSDLASSMNFMNILKNEFFSDARVVDTSTIQDKLGQITNFGVRMIFSDQIEAAEECTTLAGKGLTETVRRMLAMSDTLIEDKLMAVWDDPLPVNKLELATAVEKEAKVGVLSDKTLIEELGQDPKIEEANKAEEKSTATDALVNALGRVGDRGMMLPQNPIGNRQPILPPGNMPNQPNGATNPQ